MRVGAGERIGERAGERAGEGAGEGEGSEEVRPYKNHFHSIRRIQVWFCSFASFEDQLNPSESNTTGIRQERDGT